ncbi:MAG: hypothetical protein NTZ78_13285 [Candidatus Aureabacteria bacterium]|nr:hypothetical protein [Candidatus Auribacterota bacterium]
MAVKHAIFSQSEHISYGGIVEDRAFYKGAVKTPTFSATIFSSAVSSGVAYIDVPADNNLRGKRFAFAAYFSFSKKSGMSGSGGNGVEISEAVRIE